MLIHGNWRENHELEFVGVWPEAIVPRASKLVHS